MNNLKEIYQLKPPYFLKVVPVGLPAKLNVTTRKTDYKAKLTPLADFMDEIEIDSSLLKIPELGLGEHNGTITVLKNDFIDANAAMYDVAHSCFETPQALISHNVKMKCDRLTFYLEETIKSITLRAMVVGLCEIIKSGVLIKEIHINDKVFNVERGKITSGYGYRGIPLVTSGGVIENTVKLQEGHTSTHHVIRHGYVGPQPAQQMILIDDFLLVGEEPDSSQGFDTCPACNSSTIEVDGVWNCTATDCHPFLESFLNSISKQTGLPVDVLKEQYGRDEKFHYSIDSTIEEQAREEVPVDIIRTYFDILGVVGLHGILERFFGLHDQQLYCSKASAIDEMFFKYLTFGNAEIKRENKPVVYYPPLNSKPVILTIGEFDGLSRQTLELKLAGMGVGVTSVVQEADLVIAGGGLEDDEFFEYVKEVSNITIVETGGSIHTVFDLMKYI